jgi:flagellar protein FlgJ
MANALTPTTTARSYLDFAGLGELRGKAQQNDDHALRETAQQFEALFIQMMLKSMREANNVMKSDLVESQAAETFEGMYDKEMSVQMAKRNTMGLADMLVRQLGPKDKVADTAEQLKLKGQTPMPLVKPQLPITLGTDQPKPMPLIKPLIKPLPAPVGGNHG